MVAPSELRRFPFSASEPINPNGLWVSPGAAGVLFGCLIQLGCSGIPAPLEVPETLPKRQVSSWNFSDLFPRQEWPVVVGTRRGLLVAAGRQPWGGGVMWGRGLDLSEDRTEYRFYAEGSSAYAVYFHSPTGAGYNLMEGWRGSDERGASVDLPVAMFGRHTENPWGLRHRAHFVEVDALTLERPANALHFIIRDVEVLDGKEGLPARLDQVLVQLRNRFDRSLDRRAPAAETILREHQRSLPESWEVIGQDGPNVVAFPTWRNQDERLEVIFFARYREVVAGEEELRWRQCPVLPMPPRARLRTVRPLCPATGTASAPESNGVGSLRSAT